MEKRLLLFFAITFALVTVWPRLFPPPEPPDLPELVEPVNEESAPAELPPRADDTARTESNESVPPIASASDEPAESDTTHEATAAEAERTVTIATSLYEMTLTNRGARIVSFVLKEYTDKAGRRYEMVGQIVSNELNVRPLDLRLENSSVNTALLTALFDSDAPSSLSVADGESRSIELRWADGRGLDVTKRLTFFGGTYRVGVEVSAEDRGRELAKAIVYGGGIGNEAAQSRFANAERGVVSSGNGVELFSAGDVEDGEADLGNIAAIGVMSHYFSALMIPARSEAGSFGSRLESNTIQQPQAGKKAEGEEGEPELVDRDVITAELLTPATPVELTLYVGPKELERLQALGPGMDEIIEFGSWMRYPAVVLRTWLLAINDYVGNYGWSIVLLTVLINILLLPLKHYSFVSMRKMQKIAPQTQKIRERYKKVKPTDPRYHEMNQEMQALYKKHGVNPVSGCLPMLLMIPFFFAFYRMLSASIELRQAPFMFWVEDLAVHDPFFVLPILMGATQLVIQKMTPQAGADPVQAKIMAFMPVLFTVMLAGAPAGLVLYWFSNNVVSMAQQKITNRLMGDREAKAEGKPEKPDKSQKADKAGDAAQPDVKSIKAGKKRKGKKGR